MNGMTRCAAAVLLAGLTPTLWADNQLYQPGSAKDPYVRNAQFEADSGHYFSASSSLLQVEARAPGGHLAPLLRRQLAQDLLSFGVPDRATQLTADPETKDLSASQRADLVIELASFRFERGDYNAAEAALQSVKLRPGNKSFIKWQDLMSRTLMAEGRYSDAIEVLTKPDNADTQTPYERYNLAMALLLNGETNTGITLLDRAGRMTVSDPESLALRDKANLVLAYHFLYNQQGATAVPLFERVRTDGPFSNPALLGLGWAMITPKGDRQRLMIAPDQPVDPIEPYGGPETLGSLIRPGYYDPFWLQWNADRLNRNLGMAKLPKDKKERFKTALVPWSMLLKRDPMDPSVQEAMLAIPFSLDGLGAHTESVDYYKRAIDALQQTLTRLDTAEQNVRSGAMVHTIIQQDPTDESGWMWHMRVLPDAPETFYLQSVLADHEFQSAIKNYRDLSFLLTRLDIWAERIKNARSTYHSGQITNVPVDGTIDHSWQTNQNTAEAPVQPPLLRFSDFIGGDAASSPAAGSSAGLASTTTNEPPLKAPDAAAEGPWEELMALQGRIRQLKPAIQKAMQQQSLVLQAIALKDLDAQKKQANQYMAKARFALARVYDRPANGPKP
jgi:tetratricopeptide (TPR) repeat protein